MTSGSSLERRLFWLCIGLKVAFWAALAAGLVKGIWAAAIGRQAGPPITLLWVILALAVLQVGAWIAWLLVRRARLRQDPGQLRQGAP